MRPNVLPIKHQLDRDDRREGSVSASQVSPRANQDRWSFRWHDGQGISRGLVVWRVITASKSQTLAYTVSCTRRSDGLNRTTQRQPDWRKLHTKRYQNIGTWLTRSHSTSRSFEPALMYSAQSVRRLQLPSGRYNQGTLNTKTAYQISLVKRSL